MRLTVGIICLCSIFSTGYVLGVWTTRAGVEGEARRVIGAFAQEVDVLTGRLQTLESVCGP